MIIPPSLTNTGLQDLFEVKSGWDPVPSPLREDQEFHSLVTNVNVKHLRLIGPLYFLCCELPVVYYYFLTNFKSFLCTRDIKPLFYMCCKYFLLQDHLLCAFYYTKVRHIYFIDLSHFFLYKQATQQSIV